MAADKTTIGYSTENEILDELALERMEEECARMTRWRDTLLEQGKPEEAESLSLEIIKLEEAISNMEETFGEDL